MKILSRNLNLFRKPKFNSNFLSNLHPLKKAYNSSAFLDLTPLTALSPLDGRYSSQLSSLKTYYSEAGLIKYRTIVEIEWLKFLITKVINEKDLNQKFQINSESEVKDTIQKLDSIINDFDIEDAKRVKEIENKTNHDVKSVEYFIKDEMRKRNISNSLCELVHFCCTSEDINNVAWSLIIKDSLNFVYHPKLTSLINILARMAEDNCDVPMMSRTHGQAATTTTVGKELANYAYRLNEQQYLIRGMKIKAKMNGAVGNFNAHYAVLPDVNWMEKSQMFIDKLGLEWNPYTTQIENHDSLCAVFNTTSLINSILIGLSRDFWGYISMNYFKQRLNKDEVGSSTMPHKINPIDFENAEGNLGLANSMLIHMSTKLPISRFQRDLSDSTVLRNIGSAMGYTVLAYNSITKGLAKLDVNKDVIEEELNSHWELLAEPLQTVMRFHGIENPYELLKELTRGKRFSREEYLCLIENINLPEDVKENLKKLKPSNYLGNASKMANDVREFLK